MHIAIILVAYRNPDDLVECFSALARQHYRDFSVHVCENGGPEAFENLVAALGAAESLHGGQRTSPEEWTARLSSDDRPVTIHRAPGNLGYAGGINHCLDRIDALDAIWILNPDTEADPDALAALVARMREGGYGMVGSRIVSTATNRVQLYGGRWRKLMARGFNIGLGAAPDAVPDVAAIESEMDYINGASMLVSRAFIEQVGRMRDDYFLYCEEVDWCLRRGNLKLGYAHGSLILHAHGSTIGSNRDRARRSRLSVYLDERNRLLLTRRIYPGAYPLVVLVTLGLTLQYLRHGAVTNFRHALSGWFAALRGETGVPTWLENT